MATIKDIAHLAGVSQGTVSNVLNGKGIVSSEKIRLVEEVAAQLGYTVSLFISNNNPETELEILPVYFPLWLLE